MCASCVKRAIADETALEIHHRGVDINGDLTLDLEYALPRSTPPAQPVHRVERPVAPKPRDWRKPCETCTGEITLDLSRDDGSMFSFTMAEHDFKRQTRCDWCSTLGLNASITMQLPFGWPSLAEMHRFKDEHPDKYARILANASKPRELRPLVPASREAE